MTSTDFYYPYLISSARDKEFGVEKKKGKTKTAPFRVLQRLLVGLLLKSLLFVVRDGAANSPAWAQQKWKRPSGFQLSPGILSLGLLTSLSLPASCPRSWPKNQCYWLGLLQDSGCLPLASWSSIALPLCWMQGITRHQSLMELGESLVWCFPA